MIKIADTDNRDAMAVVEEQCRIHGLEYELKAFTDVLFGAREWRYELWINTPNDDGLPTAA